VKHTYASCWTRKRRIRQSFDNNVFHWYRLSINQDIQTTSVWLAMKPISYQTLFIFFFSADFFHSFSFNHPLLLLISSTSPSSPQLPPFLANCKTRYLRPRLAEASLKMGIITSMTNSIPYEKPPPPKNREYVCRAMPVNPELSHLIHSRKTTQINKEQKPSTRIKVW